MRVVSLHEGAPEGADPLRTIIPGYQITPDRYLQALPYMSLIRPQQDGRGALYMGGSNPTIRLPQNIKYVVSLHHTGYRIDHSLAGRAYFEAVDSLEQSPDPFIPAAEVAETFMNQGDGDVLVHCWAGLNRSGAVTALTLRLVDDISGEQAIEQLRLLRSPDVLFNETFADFVRFAQVA